MIKNMGKTKNGNFYTIGNGGFSLRSFKLLESPTKYKLRDNKIITNNHEDGFFAFYIENSLKKQGLKWAPFEIASEFAILRVLFLLKNFYFYHLVFMVKKCFLLFRFTKPLHFLISRISKFLI